MKTPIQYAMVMLGAIWMPLASMAAGTQVELDIEYGSEPAKVLGAPILILVHGGGW